MPSFFRWPLTKNAAASAAVPASTTSTTLIPFGEDFLAKLEAIRLLAHRQHRGLHAGERQSRELGHGLEFADRRPYVAGDDIRTVDWNVLARLDEAHIRLNQRDADLPIRIAVDVSRSMQVGAASKMHLAQQLAAALAYIALAGQDRVSLALFADGDAITLPLARGKAQIFAILDFLRRPWPASATDLLASCKRLTRASARAGTTLVVSDFYDLHGAIAGLRHLRYHKHEVICLQVVDPEQANPATSLRRGTTRLVDTEHVDASNLTAEAWLTDELLRDYALAHEAYCQELARACNLHAINYVRLTSDMSFERAVLASLRRQGVMR